MQIGENNTKQIPPYVILLQQLPSMCGSSSSTCSPPSDLFAWTDARPCPTSRRDAPPLSSTSRRHSTTTTMTSHTAVIFQVCLECCEGLRHLTNLGGQYISISVTFQANLINYPITI